VSSTSATLPSAGVEVVEDFLGLCDSVAISGGHRLTKRDNRRPTMLYRKTLGEVRSNRHLQWCKPTNRKIDSGSPEVG
jgi:hypothetical protein